MKQCKKCGLVQDDRRQCIDCGAILGEPMSSLEEERYSEELSDTVERMSNRCEEFYVSPVQRGFGYGAVAATILSIVMLILGANFTPHAGEVFIYAWIGLICSIDAALELIFPKAMWTIYSFRYRFWIDGDHSPSDTYHIVTKFTAYTFFGIGALSSAWSLIQLIICLN